MFFCKPERPQVDTREVRDPFPLDSALRLAGWCIAHRPAKGEPRWSRDGLRTSVPQSEAVKMVRG